MTAPHLSDAQAQDLADGLLPPRESEPLERHAAGCPSCRAAVEGYRLLSGALADLDVPVPPEGFTDGVLARIDANESRASQERRLAGAIFGGMVAATAAAFAVAGAGAWAPAVSSLAEALALGVRVARACAAFVPAGAAALLLPIAVGAALLALPFLAALSRLVPAPGSESV